ncbi:MAG: CpaF family protein [Eggerthellaceae bacterium]|jgi:pilus assembly protein CpaF|nr:CpaF family protein [Eggerthellaceae bacterium]MDR2721941.1 CpaF family protein [Coriobacteriaceae bacterium]
MSLMERVQKANNTDDLFVIAGKSRYLEELKSQLQQRISSDEIASIMAENPARAKNEIRSACARIFQDDRWVSQTADERETLVEELINTVFGLGPLEALLSDENITEIMVNGEKALFFERGGKLYPAENTFKDEEQVRALIDRIIGPLGRRIDEASPMVNARLKQGHRVNAIIPPLSLDGPVLTIRKFREHLYTLEEMEEIGSAEKTVREFLVWAVLSRKNIAVSGGTGSGKTTLLNALSCKIPADERIITIEDSAELKFSGHPHVIRLEARPQNAEGTGEVNIRDLVINALRMRPDRIIVGECRGGEALDMLQAMNTGHDGSLTTLHANSSEDAVMRLSTMVRYVADLPVDVIETQIAAAIDLIVQITRDVEGKRFVCEIASFCFSRKASLGEVSTLYRRNRYRDQGEWLICPDWIDSLAENDLANTKEVALWKQESCLPALPS